jgi:PAS domain S-box-containing protein
MVDSTLFMLIFSGGVALAAGAILWLMFQARRGEFAPLERSTRYLQTGVVALIALFYVADMVAHLTMDEEGVRTAGGGTLRAVQIYFLSPAILIALIFIGFGLRRSFKMSTEASRRLETAEQGAEFERRRMEDFANAASDWFWETDAQHRYTWFSERVEEFTAFPREWHYGKTREELGVPDISPETWAAHLDDLRHHRPYRNFEYSRKAPDGVKWIRSSGVPVFDRDGGFLGYRGTGIDITEAMRTSETHHEIEQNFRSVIEHSIQGLLVLDGISLVFANEALARMFGFKTAVEVLETGTLNPLVHPEDLAALRDRTGRRLAGEISPQRARWRGMREDGSVIWVESISNPVQWSGKQMLLAALIDVTDEVALELETRSAEARLLSAMNAMGQPVALFDVDDRLVVCNDIYREILDEKADSVKVGMAFEEIVGLAVAQGVYRDADQDDADFKRLRLERHRNPGKPLAVTFKDGRAMELHEQRLSTGETLLLTLDVTERSKADELVRASEARFRDFAEISSDWFWETDVDHRFSLITGERLRSLGFETDNLIGLSLWEAVGADPVTDPFWRDHRAVLEARREFRGLEYWMIDPNGLTRFCRASGRPVFDESGVFTGYRGVAADITAQRTAEQRVQENESLVRSVIENMPSMIAIRDLEGHILMANKAFADVVDRSTDDVQGRPVADLFPGVHADEILDHHRRVIETGEAIVREVQIPTAQGSITVLTMRFPIRDASGDVVMVGMTSTDITDRKMMELDLRHAKEHAEGASIAKSAFLARMSHELRTPLNAIMGFSQLIDQEVLGPLENPKYREYMGDIVKSASFLLNLVNDLLDMTRIEAQQLDLSLVSCDLKDAVTEAVRLVEQTLRHKRLSFVNEVPADMSKALADRRALHQVLVNLLSNASKFTPDDGRIVIGAAPIAEGRISVWILDSGIGMSKDEVERAVQPFSTSTAGSELSQPSEGVGLGLAIVKGIVEAHGGDLVIESEVGRGTRVSFSLASDRLGQDLFSLDEPRRGA